MGYVIEEWGVQYVEGAPITERPPYMYEKTPKWTEETARREVSELNAAPLNIEHGRVARLFWRERVVTPDEVTEWAEVG